MNLQTKTMKMKLTKREKEVKEAANKAYELMVVGKVHSMCEESLSPELFEMWLKVKSSLQFTRNVE